MSWNLDYRHIPENKHAVTINKVSDEYIKQWGAGFKVLLIPEKESLEGFAKVVLNIKDNITPIIRFGTPTGLNNVELDVHNEYRYDFITRNGSYSSESLTADEVVEKWENSRKASFKKRNEALAKQAEERDKNSLKSDGRELQ